MHGLKAVGAVVVQHVRGGGALLGAAVVVAHRYAFAQPRRVVIDSAGRMVALGLLLLRIMRVAPCHRSILRDRVATVQLLGGAPPIHTPRPAASLHRLESLLVGHVAGNRGLRLQLAPVIWLLRLPVVWVAVLPQLAANVTGVDTLLLLVVILHRLLAPSLPRLIFRGVFGFLLLKGNGEGGGKRGCV